MSKTYNIFIRHSWAYSDAYEKLCIMLDSKTYFNYNNHSILRDIPIHTNGTDKDLKAAIIRRMRGCDKVLNMSGNYSTDSKWINKEITIANDEFSNKKPIVGVKPWTSTQVSSVVADNADELIGWNASSIVTAIREYSL